MEPGENTLVLAAEQTEKAHALYLKRHGYSRPVKSDTTVPP